MGDLDFCLRDHADAFHISEGRSEQAGQLALDNLADDGGGRRGPIVKLDVRAQPDAQRSAVLRDVATFRHDRHGSPIAAHVEQTLNRDISGNRLKADVLL